MKPAPPNPVLDQTGRSDIAGILAQRVNCPRPAYQGIFLFVELGQHVLRRHVIRIVIAESVT